MWCLTARFASPQRHHGKMVERTALLDRKRSDMWRRRGIGKLENRRRGLQTSDLAEALHWFHASPSLVSQRLCIRFFPLTGDRAARWQHAQYGIEHSAAVSKNTCYAADCDDPPLQVSEPVNLLMQLARSRLRDPPDIEPQRNLNAHPRDASAPRERVPRHGRSEPSGRPVACRRRSLAKRYRTRPSRVASR